MAYVTLFGAVVLSTPLKNDSSSPPRLPCFSQAWLPGPESRPNSLPPAAAKLCPGRETAALRELGQALPWT